MKTLQFLHDLRAPAARAKAAVERMLSLDTDRQRMRELASAIKRSLDVMECRLNSILEMAQSPAPAPVIVRPCACDIVSIAHEVRRDMELIYGPRIRLQAAYGIKGFWDSDGLRRVLEHLVDHGFRQSGQDGVVTIAVRQEASSTSISVHNEGALIDATLALSCVRDAVEAHGGTMAVKSTQKEGTIFIVTLPNDTRPEFSRIAF